MQVLVHAFSRVSQSVAHCIHAVVVWLWKVPVLSSVQSMLSVQPQSACPFARLAVQLWMRGCLGMCNTVVLEGGRIFGANYW